jgi:predicted secreted hydrolase
MLIFKFLALITIVFLTFLAPAQAATTDLTWLDTPQPSDQAFTKATKPNNVQFPRDLGPHPDFRSEWWYYTGNLQTEQGRDFGFELTFFRQAISPETAAQTSAQTSPWRNPQIYSAHFTVSDIANKKFYFQERFSRSALALAGASSQPYGVWIEDWRADAIDDKTVHLSATTPEATIDLQLNQTLPPVLQGDRGLSIKGKAEGNASYYYSIVQQATQGQITLNGQTYPVTGVTWKDHEYSTSALDPGTIGWNWFAAQFDDGAALMLYVLRREDGTISSTSAGKYIAPDGQTQSLSAADYQVRPMAQWKSPTTKASYPTQWEVTIPKLELKFQAQALIPNQEVNSSTASYWEGAVAYKGTDHDRPLTGKGYIELTGYRDRLDQVLGEKA